MAKLFEVTMNNVVWVSESGEYGVGSIVCLPYANVTMEHLTKLALLAESDRFDYITHVINGEDVSGWEIPTNG